jgi:Kef-type K+ transport system membrane component KefB
MEMNIWIISAIILAIVVVSKLLAKKTSTVDVLWLIIFGALFANIGWLPEHNETLDLIGEWGIVFIMFALGFDEDLSHFKEGLLRSWGIAVIGALFPFFTAYFTAQFFGFDNNAALLWGLTMTATAVSLTMVTLKNEDLHKSVAATGIMTAAVIDDILSLIGVAIVVPIALASSSAVGGLANEGLNAVGLAVILLKVVAFFFLVIVFGLFAFPETVPEKLSPNASLIQKVDFYFTQIFKYINIKDLLLAYKGEFTPLIMISVAMSLGAVAHMFDFHPAIGAYLAGLFLKKEYFIFDAEEERRTDQHFESSKNVVDHIAFTVFGPIFFVTLGTKIHFDAQILMEILPMVLTLFAGIFIFQILSAALAAKYTGGYTTQESVMIGLGMLGRAELAFIVINLAFTEHHIISVEEFYTLIFTLFLLNVSVPLTIKWWKPYYLGEKEMRFFTTKVDVKAKGV